ncbi:MAG: acetate/propionate family kinase [Coriobacteriales bacterium]
MKILVFNAGSSSLKYKLFEAADAETMEVLAQGMVDAIGTEHCCLKHDGQSVPAQLGSCRDALPLVFDQLVGDGKALASLDELDAVGHRVAHGGDAFGCSAVITDEVVATIRRFNHLAPLHNPSALEVVACCRELLPQALQVAAFDTAFHQTMPARNYVYPIPYRYYEDYGIRRFGFHGMSHKYVSRRAAQFLGRNPHDLKMLTCHLGSGASLAAIDHGISMDTTMGYTPLDGVMMGTRSGSVDPAIITAIMEREGLSAVEMDAILNRESGLLGVSGVTGDLRKLKEVIAAGGEDAERSELAYDIFLTSIRRQIGAYLFELAGVDCIVCTAGVGENDPYARRLIFRGLEPFGICIDQERNMITGREDRIISTDDSAVKVLVIPTDEEAEIARDVALISAGEDISDPYKY